MTAELVLLAGLPGCGKTTYLCQLCTEGWLAFDDFKNHAYNNSSRFRDSRKCAVLLAALREGLRCVVADIDFCKIKAREEAESVLHVEMPELVFTWRFFTNDPSSCEANIRRRKRNSLETDIQKMRQYSACYSIPNGACVLPVWNPST